MQGYGTLTCNGYDNARNDSAAVTSCLPSQNTKPQTCKRNAIGRGDVVSLVSCRCMEARPSCNSGHFLLRSIPYSQLAAGYYSDTLNCTLWCINSVSNKFRRLGSHSRGRQAVLWTGRGASPYNTVARRSKAAGGEQTKAESRSFSIVLHTKGTILRQCAIIHQRSHPVRKAHGVNGIMPYLTNM